MAKVGASDAAASDYFGYAVAVSGDIALVGAIYNDDAGVDSGSAYIYERNEGGTDNWGQVAKFVASDAAASDEFGSAVAVSGDIALVGAPWKDDGGPNSGSAYIFGVGGDDDGDDDDDEKEEEARRPGVVLALVGSGVGAIVVLAGIGAAVFILARRSSDDEADAKDAAEAERGRKPDVGEADAKDGAEVELAEKK